MARGIALTFRRASTSIPRLKRGGGRSFVNDCKIPKVMWLLSSQLWLFLLHTSTWRWTEVFICRQMSRLAPKARSLLLASIILKRQQHKEPNHSANYQGFNIIIYFQKTRQPIISSGTWTCHLGLSWKMTDCSNSKLFGTEQLSPPTNKYLPRIGSGWWGGGGCSSWGKPPSSACQQRCVCMFLRTDNIPPGKEAEALRSGMAPIHQ